MKQLLLSFLVLFSSAITMEREKKRTHEDENISSKSKGRPFDFHSHYNVVPVKKQVVFPENFIYFITTNDRKAITRFFDQNKVAFEHRLDFFSRAALAIFCKNAQLSVKDKTTFLTLIKQDAEHIKFKFMAINAPQNSEVQEGAKNITIDEWRKEFQRKQLERLQQAYDLISTADKDKIAITSAIVKHLHTLATIQKINETNAKTLGLRAPLIVPHNLYLGYACEQAEKEANPAVINFLNTQDTAQNRIAYQKWLEHHSSPGNK